MTKYEKCSVILKILDHKTSKAVAQLQHDDLPSSIYATNSADLH